MSKIITDIRASLLVGFSAGSVGAAAHLLRFRDLRRARADHLTLAALGLAIDLTHAVSFGWPVGWPMPGAELLFLPFFTATFIVTHATIAALLSLTPQRRRV